MQKFKLLLSLALLGYGLYIIYQGLSVESVPVSAEVIQSYKEYLETSTYRPGSYSYTFEYEYTYLDKRYVSDRYTYGGRDTAEAVCNYKTGDTLTAYVDPKNPASSVIKRDVSGFVYALTIVGLLMFIQTILAYIIGDKEIGHPKLLKKVHNFIGPMIGMLILLGGIGYFVYVVILAAVTQCVN